MTRCCLVLLFHCNHADRRPREGQSGRALRSGKRQRPASLPHQHGHGIRMGSHYHHIMQTRSILRTLLHGSCDAQATMLRGYRAMTCNGRHEGERQTNRFAIRNDPIFLVNFSDRLVVIRQCCLRQENGQLFSEPSSRHKTTAPCQAESILTRTVPPL